MKTTTRKTYPFRSFYKGKERIAFYVISILGEESHITVYSDTIRKGDSEIDSFLSWVNTSSNQRLHSLR